MKFLKTVQIQLISEKQKISETVDTFIQAMNYVSCYARKHRIYSKNKIQEHIYYNIREKFDLKSQMTINSIRDTVTQYKGKHKSNRFLKDKIGNPKPIQFKSLSMRLNYPRDYSFKKNGLISINSVYGRLIIPYKIGTNQKKILDNKDWQIKSSILSIRERA
jgi:predicted transposase